MIKISTLSTFVFHFFLFLFCIPLILPQFELFFITLQFSILAPIYLLLSFPSANLQGQSRIILCFLLIILLLLGLPGSIVGWASMATFGFLLGANKKYEYSKVFKGLKTFIWCCILFSIWVLYLNSKVTFDFDLLSDYFEKSSINTIPILMVCTCNLVCAIYFYEHFRKGSQKVQFNKDLALIIGLLITSAVTVWIFEFRSGLGLFVLISFFVFGILDFKTSLFFFVIALILVFVFIDFNALLIQFLTPGRSDLASVAEEVSDGSLRYERVIDFWRSAAFSKHNFASWSKMFSFSGMSDFVAALFPISLIFFIPCIVYFRLFRKFSSKNWLSIVIVLVCALSSFIVSLMQPDFYSLFTFFAITSIVYFGEKSINNTVSKSLIVSK
jgi:hypothetical protein